MNDIRFVSLGPGRGDLYINGQKVPGVMGIEPDLFSRDSVAEVTVKLSVKTFTFEPAESK